MKESNRLNNYDKNIITYDFETLYTKIPHNKLKRNIKTFISTLFEYKKRKYINISSKSAQFSDKVSKHGSFTELEIIHQIDFTIDNCFISYNHLVFKQTIGIPMGTNCASHLANIFLHIYEKTFICKLMEEGNIEYISKLGTIFRYQDDLINFGNSNIANDILNNIYPKDMIIKNTNLSSNNVTYLDLAITMKDDQYHYKSYDKRKDFNFSIINFPNLQGNIPNNPAYGVFTSQIILYCATNMHIEDFKKDIMELIIKLIQKGYCRYKLLNTFKQFTLKRMVLWAHFGYNIMHHKFLDSIFQV